MEFHSPAHPLVAPTSREENGLWRPGSSYYASITRADQQMERTHMDRLRCKQDLQKLCEDTPENSYDLSLKDIVDPCFSISGNLKAIVAENELKSHEHVCSRGKSRSWKNPIIPKLSFSFSFPGLRGKSRRLENPTLYAWKPPSPLHNEEKASSTSKHSLRDKLSSSKFTKSSPEVCASSRSKIHPSNQCSSCSSFTIFFKSSCLVCGRSYCSICAKEHMNNLSAGFKCKVPCKNGPLRKRFSQKVSSRCWPLWSSGDMQKLQPYTVDSPS